MKAILQGEFHTSGADREALLTHVDDDVDALFLEQRKDIYNPETWSVGYWAFIVGVLTLFWLQGFLGRGPQLKKEVDVPVYDEIDTPLPDLYPRFPLYWRAISGAVAFAVLLFGVYSPILTVPMISLPPVVLIIYTTIVKLMAVAGSFLLFSFFLIFPEERRIGSRDVDMADSITEISENEDYETVVVSCGAAHLARLPDLLEKKGWEVEVNDSEYSGFAMAWRW